MSSIVETKEDSSAAVATAEDQYEWDCKVDNYHLIVRKTPAGLYHPCVLKDDRLLKSFGATNELADARRMTKAWYHRELQDLQPGINYVPRDLLEPIPVNRRVYYVGQQGSDRHAQDVKEMLEALSSETGYLSTLQVDELGGIISGEIRWSALGEESLKERYPLVPVEVKRYPTQWDKVQALILENRSKKRTKDQVEAEQLAVLAAEQELAKTRQGRRDLEANVIRANAEEIAAKKLQEAGISDDSGKTLKKKQYVNGLLQTVDTNLAQKIKTIKDKSLESAYSLFKDVPEEDREVVADRMIETGNIGGGRGKKNVKAVYAEVKAEKVQAGQDAGLLDLFKIAQDKGDDPENNRLTPPEIIELVEDLYEQVIDVDVFSEIEKKNVPAMKHISIIEDAFATPWSKENGAPAKIFANIPWKIPGDSIKRLRAEIQANHVEQAVVVASNTILHSSDCLSFIEEYAPVVLPWRRGNGTKRLDFKPGSYLLHHKPEAVSGNSNKDVVFLYYGPNQERFKTLFSVHGVLLVTEQSARKRVFGYWEEAIASWKDGESLEVKGIFLSIRPSANGLWEVVANDQPVPGLDVAATEEEAKVMAIAHAITSKDAATFTF